MEDFNFPQYHLSLFVVIKIMKQNNKSTDFDCSHLSDSTATRCNSPTHWLWGLSFFMLKYLRRYLLVFKKPEIEDLFWARLKLNKLFHDRWKLYMFLCFLWLKILPMIGYTCNAINMPDIHSLGVHSFVSLAVRLSKI